MGMAVGGDAREGGMGELASLLLRWLTARSTARCASLTLASRDAVSALLVPRREDTKIRQLASQRGHAISTRPGE